MHTAPRCFAGSQTSLYNRSIVLDHYQCTSSCRPQVVYGAQRPENKLTSDQSRKREIALKWFKEKMVAWSKFFLSVEVVSAAQWTCWMLKWDFHGAITEVCVWENKQLFQSQLCDHKNPALCLIPVTLTLTLTICYLLKGKRFLRWCDICFG